MAFNSNGIPQRISDANSHMSSVSKLPGMQIPSSKEIEMSIASHKRYERAPIQGPVLRKPRNFEPDNILGKKNPHKCITDESLMPFWQESEAYIRIMEFVQLLSQNVKDIYLSTPVIESKKTQQILDLLKTLDRNIDHIPPSQEPQRFGNTSFRNWHNQMLQDISQWIKSTLPNVTDILRAELFAYLSDSFGNAIRIDYGSGHELAFLSGMLTLYSVQFIHQQDFTALVTKVFSTYLKVVQKLQKVYRLEPAGSHGVWGLDDYQFLSYVFGAAQLINHKHITPKNAIKEDVYLQYKKDFIYLECINFVNEMKSGPFFEHSPILYDISGVAKWQKVYTGLLKMYRAEVLAKFPIVQPTVF